MAVISPALAKALSDRLYDKQRAATIKIERLVLDALDADDEQRIYELLAELSTEYATSEREASRIGGLVALAATAVALTHLNIRPFLPHIVPPIVSALSDGESKVRYFACESLYNVTKVSRGHILRWFNDIFDGLARVTADSVKTVKDGADYLDRLVKDVVAEQAATCLDWYEDEGEAEREREEEEEGARQTSPAAAEAAADGSELDTQENALAAATSLQTRGPRLAFSLDKFVPLLAERMHTYKPATRLYLIEWIRVLDSVPGLDMIAYLPEFLDGLLRFLSDPNDDVRSKTQSLLGELLNEMTECVELQQLGGEAEDSAMRSRYEHGSGFGPGSGSGSGSGFQASGRFTSPSTAGLPEELRMAARRKRIREERAESAASHGTTPPPAHQQAAASANAISIEFARVMQILIPHLESNDLEIQGTALGWVYQLTWLCPQTVVCAVPRLVNAVLPSVSHPMPAHRHTAEEVNARLRQLVRDAPAPLAVSAGADSRIEEPLNYDHAATAVMELFAKNVHEPTKVAGMQWLLLLHGKAPWRILTPEDMSFPVLLKMLSDSSEQVVRLDLELFAQISLNSSQGETGEDRAHSHKHHAYLQRFLGSLLQMFATDRVLLETRAALMVRQLCAVLDPQLVFCMISEHLCEEERADLEFVSVMVQHLSWILVTAPETERLRRVLRGYNAALPLDMPHLRTSPPPLTTAQQQQALQRSRQQNQQQQQQQQQNQQQQSQQQKNAGRTTPAADIQRADRTRQTLAMAVQRIQRGVEQNRRNHALFTQLFGAWCHNPAACLTLCLLSQHYETSAELVRVFGQVPLDLTVSFLVQLDKLVQLIESPVFTFLRLQLLDPSEQPQLLRTLYGLLMLLPQSSAFAILRNRLASVGGSGGGAVSPFSCGGNGGAAIGPMVRGSAASGASAGGGGGGGDAMDHDLAPASRGCQYHCHYHYHMHRHPAASASSGTSRSATASTVSTSTAAANNNSTGAAADVRRIVQLLVATEQSYQSGGVAASHRQQGSAKSISSNGNGNSSATAAAAIPESEGPRGAENSSSNVASDLPTAAQILQQMGDLQLYHHPSLARDRDDHDDAFTNSGVAAAFSDYSEFEGAGGGSCACGCRYCCNHTGKSSSGSIVSEGSIVGRLVAEYRSVRQRHTEAIMRSRGQSQHQHQHQHQQHNQNHHYYK